MRGRSYSPSPPPPRHSSRRGRSPSSPRGGGRYAAGSRGGGRERDRDLPTSLLVRNLRHDCRPDDLRAPFEHFGAVKDIYLPRDYYTKPAGKCLPFFLDHHELHIFADYIPLSKVYGLHVVEGLEADTIVDGLLRVIHGLLLLDTLALQLLGVADLGLVAVITTRHPLNAVTQDLFHLPSQEDTAGKGRFQDPQVTSAQDPRLTMAQGIAVEAQIRARAVAEAEAQARDEAEARVETKAAA
ncbi:hypothetical protein ACFE04_027362 [Oxalis oulophora]